jgi:hypothetical protein
LLIAVDINLREQFQRTTWTRVLAVHVVDVTTATLLLRVLATSRLPGVELHCVVTTATPCPTHLRHHTRGA